MRQPAAPQGTGAAVRFVPQHGGLLHSATVPDPQYLPSLLQQVQEAQAPLLRSLDNCVLRHRNRDQSARHLWQTIVRRQLGALATLPAEQRLAPLLALASSALDARAAFDDRPRHFNDDLVRSLVGHARRHEGAHSLTHSTSLREGGSTRLARSVARTYGDELANEMHWERLLHEPVPATVELLATLASTAMPPDLGHQVEERFEGMLATLAVVDHVERRRAELARTCDALESVVRTAVPPASGFAPLLDPQVSTPPASLLRSLVGAEQRLDAAEGNVFAGHPRTGADLCRMLLRLDQRAPRATRSAVISEVLTTFATDGAEPARQRLLKLARTEPPLLPSSDLPPRFHYKDAGIIDLAEQWLQRNYRQVWYDPETRSIAQASLPVWHEGSRKVLICRRLLQQVEFDGTGFTMPIVGAPGVAKLQHLSTTHKAYKDLVPLLPEAVPPPGTSAWSADELTASWADVSAEEVATITDALRQRGLIDDAKADDVSNPYLQKRARARFDARQRAGSPARAAPAAADDDELESTASETDLSAPVQQALPPSSLSTRQRIQRRTESLAALLGGHVLCLAGTGGRQTFIEVIDEPPQHPGHLAVRLYPDLASIGAGKDSGPRPPSHLLSIDRLAAAVAMGCAVDLGQVSEVVQQRGSPKAATRSARRTHRSTPGPGSLS